MSNPEGAVAGVVTGQSYIRVQGLSVTYDGTIPAVAGLDMLVDKGEFVAVLGPSGCGKSTLLQVISGILRPQAGVIEIAGRAIGPAGGIPIGYVFQDHRLLPWRTVSQNIALVLKASGVTGPAVDERIERYLSMLDISRFRDAWPMRLSGGQRQRVSIARALALQPAVVLMDEPFSTLDEVTARLMRQQLVELWQESGQTILFVTHSVREAVFLADRIYILTKGPARTFGVVDVPIARPRRYEDPELTELEAKIVERVMGAWGLSETGGGAAKEG